MNLACWIAERASVSGRSGVAGQTFTRATLMCLGSYMEIRIKQTTTEHRHCDGEELSLWQVWSLYLFHSQIVQID